MPPAGGGAAAGFCSRFHRRRRLWCVPVGGVGLYAVQALVLQGGIEGHLLPRGEPGTPGPGPVHPPAQLPVVALQQAPAVGRRDRGQCGRRVLVRGPRRKWLDGLDFRGAGFVRGGGLGELGVERLLGSKGLLVVRQQALRPSPLQAEEAVQGAADLAIRLATVAQDQGEARPGVLVVVEGPGEAGAALGKATEQFAFQALGPAGAEDAGGDGLGEVAATGPTAPSSARTAAKWAWLAAAVSPSASTVTWARARRPWARLFIDERRLPSSVTGPRELAPFWRAMSARDGFGRKVGGQEAVGMAGSAGAGGS